VSRSVWEKIKAAFTGGGDGPPETAGFESPPALSGLFVMKVEDVFSISGRGVVVTGKVEAGSVRKGDAVVLRSAAGTTRRCRVTGVEKFRKILESASAGDNVGLLLEGVEKGDIARGDVLGNV
jgi:translation elongation factor EF-Tu-like GTPase